MPIYDFFSKIKKSVHFTKKHFLYEFKETINHFDIYLIEQQSRNNHFEHSCFVGHTLKIEEFIDEIETNENKRVSCIFSLSNTFISSATYTQNSESSISFLNRSKKNAQTSQNNKFFRYTYYFIDLILFYTNL